MPVVSNAAYPLISPALADSTGVIITAVVTSIGWLAVHLLTEARDRKSRHEAAERANRIKRLEILLKHSEAQIANFYGPTHGLIHQIWATWQIKEKFRNYIDADKFSVIEHFIGEKYFATYHERIRALMRDNMHLIDGATMPKSFYEYIKHSMMEHIQITLWNERKIDTSNVPGIPFVDDFPRDVENGLRGAVARYDAILDELRHDGLSDGQNAS